jgi:hypothetical protein
MTGSLVRKGLRYVDQVISPERADRGARAMANLKTEFLRLAHPPAWWPCGCSGITAPWRKKRGRPGPPFVNSRAESTAGSATNSKDAPVPCEPRARLAGPDLILEGRACFQQWRQVSKKGPPGMQDTAVRPLPRRPRWTRFAKPSYSGNPQRRAAAIRNSRRGGEKPGLERGGVAPMAISGRSMPLSEASLGRGLNETLRLAIVRSRGTQME